jgi:hypothetical protein
VIFGKDGREEVRLAQFLISELPIATVRQHLLRGGPPPPVLDQIIQASYDAVLTNYRKRKKPSRIGAA